MITDAYICKCPKKSSKKNVGFSMEGVVVFVFILGWRTLTCLCAEESKATKRNIQKKMWDRDRLKITKEVTGDVIWGPGERTILSIEWREVWWTYGYMEMQINVSVTVNGKEWRSETGWDLKVSVYSTSRLSAECEERKWQSLAWVELWWFGVAVGGDRLSEISIVSIIKTGTT